MIRECFPQLLFHQNTERGAVFVFRSGCEYSRWSPCTIIDKRPALLNQSLPACGPSPFPRGGPSCGLRSRCWWEGLKCILFLFCSRESSGDHFEMAPEHQDGAAHQGPAGLAAHKRRAYCWLLLASTVLIASRQDAYCNSGRRMTERQ